METVDLSIFPKTFMMVAESTALTALIMKPTATEKLWTRGRVDNETKMSTRVGLAVASSRAGQSTVPTMHIVHRICLVFLGRGGCVSWRLWPWAQFLPT